MADQSLHQQNTPAEQSSFLYYTALAGGILLLGLIIVPAVLPPVEQSRDAARQSTSKNNLKQIGLAFHLYHDQHDLFPPGSTETAEGQPGHSWLTAILPYIGEEQLYRQIDFNQAWNDPANQRPFQQLINAYHNPKIQDTVTLDGYALSSYQGNQLVLQPNRGTLISEISDGVSNTIFALEAGEDFKPWADPANLTDPTQMFAPGKNTPYAGGKHVLFGDGRVQFIPEDIDPEILKALSTPDGGDKIGEF